MNFVLDSNRSTHRLELNLTRWPVVEISNPPSFSDAEWDRLLVQIIEVIRHDQPFVMINDVRVGPPPSAKQRKAIARMYEQNIYLVKENWKGTAIITSSSLIQGAITALNWLMPPPHPAKVFSRYSEGEKWAIAQLDQTLSAQNEAPPSLDPSARSTSKIRTL